MDDTFPDLEHADWEDIEREALHCPVLHAAVTVARQGATSRERALTAIALFLSRERREWMQREAERVALLPARPLF